MVPVRGFEPRSRGWEPRISAALREFSPAFGILKRAFDILCRLYNVSPGAHAAHTFFDIRRDAGANEAMPMITITAAHCRDPWKSNRVLFDTEGPVERDDNGCCYCTSTPTNPWDRDFDAFSGAACPFGKPA